MKKLLLFCFAFGAFAGTAQTWSDDVAGIVYNKCSKCHHDGGLAPFALMSYGDVSSMISSIEDAVTNDEMPPWPPDNNYQQYSHPRSLSATEKSTMLTWIGNGFPEGNQANAPAPPIFNEGSILGNGDLTVQIPTYMSKANGMDDYVCFSIPAGLAQDRIIRAMEIIPGNRAIVHHALIYVDDTGSYPTDTVGGDCGGPPDATLITGYTPGASPLVFPSGSGFKLGMNIPAGSNIVFAMHYPNGSYGEYDSTKVIFHFYPPGETGVREVFAAAPLQNWGLSLPPNQVTTATATYAGSNLPIDISVLSAFPHMHLVGREITAYGLTQQNDTIKYIHIPEWDFHWQDFYFFKYIQKTPAGTTLKARAVYDNTTNNPENPNNPPQWVYAGESTTDEMLMVYFHYMYYENGDENINMEDYLTTGIQEFTNSEEGWMVYPNPSGQNEEIHIVPANLSTGDVVSLAIYATDGQLVKTISRGMTISDGFAGFEWDGTTDSGTSCSKGVYHLSLLHNGRVSHYTIVRR